MVRQLSVRLLLVLCGIALLPSMVAQANHIPNCNQRDGDDGPNTINGSPGCDEIWTYGGRDTVFAEGGSDWLSMGGEADEAHGGGGGDHIRGGDNGNVLRDLLFGGQGDDGIRDFTGPDDDYVCGGSGSDVLTVHDGDGQDTVKGADHPSGNPDQLDWDQGTNDVHMQDGTCLEDVRCQRACSP